jgi:hypothetical protein
MAAHVINNHGWKVGQIWSLSHAFDENILKQCFLFQIKYITEDSNAIHTIIQLDN